MNFIADESVDFGIINRLRKKGFKIFAIIEESPGISDQEVLRISYNKNSILITEDKDFGELAYRLKLEHKGILLIRLNDIHRQKRIDLVLELIENYSDKLENKFSVLNKKGLRIKTTQKK
jgi:predicted nuclease of predicted toxin-antitoxin system